MNLRRATLGLALFLAIAIEFPASAYVLEGPVWPAGSDIGIHFSLGSVLDPLRDGSSSWTLAALPALDAWNAQMGQVSLSQADSSVTPAYGDGFNSAFFSTTINGDEFGDALAVTIYRFTENEIHEADVTFNTAYQWDSYRGPLLFSLVGKVIPDIRRVLIHELGHALGLDHPDDSGQHVEAIMNSLISNIILPTADDTAGIQALYGPPGAPLSPRLGNISTRAQVGTGDNVLIGGFIVVGEEPKKVLIRALGPSLGDGEVNGVLANPAVELFDSTGKSLAYNDDWMAGPDKQLVIDSGIPPTNSREAALVETLSAGSYTVILSGKDGGNGIGLIEGYDLDTAPSNLTNISTRGSVGTDDGVMIGGFIVLGDSSIDVLIRAIGPSLPLAGHLVDPVLELHNADGSLIRSNDDWRIDQEDAIKATGIPPTTDAESAIVATLQPGSYTAVVKGKNATTGLALVEAYHLTK